jgi:hypothetical protein
VREAERSKLGQLWDVDLQPEALLDDERDGESSEEVR